MRNTQTVAIEMYKVTNDVSLQIMKEVYNFGRETGYDLRNQNIFRSPLVNSVYNGSETVSFLGPKI